MKRVRNFSAGPSVLPEPVLQRAAEEMLDYKGSGMCVMEMSHRSKVYEEIIGETESLLRELMEIPANYKVLFLQGGASSQFSMVPLNMKKSGCIDLVHTGMWTKKALDEAKRYCEVNVIASSDDKNFTYIPEIDMNKANPDADYFYICSNNTIYGTKYKKIPDVKVPLVSDMSSCILSEKVDVSRFGIIFAGAQKNMGPAGLTVVIIREDLIGRHHPLTPTMFQYSIHAAEGSMYNTPPTYSIYICKLVLEWLKGLGGISAMEEINIKKASILYDYLDKSAMFKGTVRAQDRSLMNIPFVTGNDDLDNKFVKEAEASGFVNIKGHRSVGGMRASIYNAMPIEGVLELVEFMKLFESRN